MARATIVKKNTLGNYPTVPLTALSALVAFTAAGASFAAGHQFVPQGNDLLIVHNANVGAQTVTITSAPDALNRLGTITAYSMAAGSYAIFDFTEPFGWKQLDGFVYLDFSATDVEYLVIHMTGKG